MFGGRALAADDVSEMLENFAGEIEGLAERTGVDEHALSEHILAKARAWKTKEPMAEPEREGALGGRWILPSAAAVWSGLGEAAAELADAGLIEPRIALVVAKLWPVYEDELLQRRPQRRPPTVRAAVPWEDRQRDYDDWIGRVADGEQRLARNVDGWTVLAELTDLSLCTPALPEERRLQGLVLDEEALPLLWWNGFRIAELRGLKADQPDDRLVIAGHPARAADWLSLHPAAATACGFTADPDDPLAWRLDGELAVRAIWWRSGSTTWRPNSHQDEVGEGWLLVATDAAVARLRAAYPRVAIRWVVRRQLRVKEHTTEVHQHASGVRTLT